jgi:hypothetical protein
MPGPEHLNELEELIAACLARGHRPIPLPHCAICARYALENLPFEGLLALIDALPPAEATAAAQRAERELAALPAGYRQQLVSVDTFAALLVAPSWPLIRSLVIDLHGTGQESWFADPRLEKIEEVTLLGYAYGGPDIRVELLRALMESPVLTNVQKL